MEVVHQAVGRPERGLALRVRRRDGRDPADVDVDQLLAGAIEDVADRGRPRTRIEPCGADDQCVGPVLGSLVLDAGRGGPEILGDGGQHLAFGVAEPGVAEAVDVVASGRGEVARLQHGEAVDVLAEQDAQGGRTLRRG